ncbi:hypothetical protein ACP70R_032418 [Stipagrostis hirtigluma subsp. patula]
MKLIFVFSYLNDLTGTCIRVFDAVVEEKKSSIPVEVFLSVCHTTCTMVLGLVDFDACEGMVGATVALALIGAHAFVVIIILLPLAVLYVFGLYICIGISLWRLIEGDYRKLRGVDNLKLALDVLYSLALAQGVLFFYWIILSFQVKGTLQLVAREQFNMKYRPAWYTRCCRAAAARIVAAARRAAEWCRCAAAVDTAAGVRQAGEVQLEEARQAEEGQLSEAGQAKEGRSSEASQAEEEQLAEERPYVRKYWVQTRERCSKEPSFAKGRDLVTFAVEQINSDDYLFGIEMLSELIQNDQTTSDVLVEKLLVTGSSSSSQVIQKLLHPLRPRSNIEPEMRVHAARVLAQVAGDICLEQFPQVIESVASLLPKPSQLPIIQIDQGSVRELPLQVLLILRGLAAKESNCRVINNTDGLVHKIMAFVSSDIIHCADHRDFDLFDIEMLVEKLLVTGLSSSSQVIQKLLHPLIPWSNPEMRVHVARVLAQVAGDICLEQFPQVIESVASLLPQPSELLITQVDFDQKLVRGLTLHGLLIIRGLAGKESNSRIINNTDGLLAKIMEFVSFDIVHRFRHDPWSMDIVRAAMQVMGCLASARGKNGLELRRQISANKKALACIMGVLDCDRCRSKELHMTSMGVLIPLLMDASLSISGDIKLFDIFFQYHHVSGNKMSVRAIQMLPFGRGTDPLHFWSAQFNVVESLLQLILQGDPWMIGRINAAKVLEQLSIHFTEYDEGLKKQLTQAMPKVLKVFQSVGEERGKNLLEQIRSLLAHPVCGREEHEEETVYFTSWRSSAGDIFGTSYNLHAEFYSALLSFVMEVCDRFISEDKDLAGLFAATVPESGPSWFPRMLKELVDISSADYHEYDGLRILKLTSKMVIVMMKHEGSYSPEDMKSLMESLSEASKIMMRGRDFNGYMRMQLGCIIDPTNSSREFFVPEPWHTMVVESLYSLVRKAWTLVCEKMLPGYASESRRFFLEEA